MKFIDDFLNGITMYRLMLYVLIFLIGIASVLSFVRILPFNPISLLLSTAFLIAVCWITNKVFANFFKAPTNFESVYITALILTLIITPAHSFKDLIFFSVAAFLAMTSKFILAIRGKHLFNPAALAVTLGAITGLGGASWWVGTPYMIPFVFLVGLLIVRKIRRFSLVLSFSMLNLIFIIGLSILRENDPFLIIQKLILESPILFFAFIMLTEPQTTPPTKKFQILYGALVGVGFSYTTPEITLLLGNIFSYIVSPKERLKLTIRKKLQIARDTYDFIFKSDQWINYLPGQYMEWTYTHKNPDSRGNRRYFTLASSPTEENLRIGIKFYPNASSFKKALVSSSPGDNIVASQLSGEFTLPKDPSKRLAFIAGGIGITPFRSMIKYLIDGNERRDIVLLYSNKTTQDIAYKDIFDKANKKLGIKTVYVTTDKDGYIDDKMIKIQVPDYNDRMFYISGPHSMVDAFEKTLRGMGIPGNQIKVDFFPGYA